MVYNKIMFKTYTIFYNIFASKQASICTVSLELVSTKLASLLWNSHMKNVCVSFKAKFFLSLTSRPPLQTTPPLPDYRQVP
jgi:hypothetical protein